MTDIPEKTLVDNLRSFPELKSLTDAQIALIVSLLIRFDESVDRVKVRFRKTEKRNISLDTIIQIRRAYAERIKAGIAAKKNDFSDIPIADRKTRLKEIQSLLEYANDESIVRTRMKLGPGEGYEEFQGKDAKLALECLNDAEKIMQEIERRDFELQKIARKTEAGPGRGATGEHPEAERNMQDEKEDDDIDFTQADTAGINFA